MNTLSRLFLGLILLVFGLAKIFPIEAFELLLLEKKIIGWNGAPLLTRLIIFWELFLGIAILLKIKIKEILQLTLLTLLVFTVYLSYDLMVNGNSEDCGCTGQLITLNSIESIIKNILLIVITIYLIIKERLHAYKKPWLVIFIVFLVAVMSTLILAPYKGPYSSAEILNKEIDLDLLPFIEGTGIPLDYKDQNVIVAFVSPKCEHCKNAIEQLSIIDQQNEILPVYLVFYAEAEKVKNFVEYFDFNFPYVIIPEKEFMQITEGKLPTIFHIDHDVLKNRWLGSEFEADEFIDLK